jgi:ubiquinone/menaquinone biosynthesis C-methylase UbiE
MADDTKQAFTGLADNYQRIRPTYPQELFHTISDLLIQSSSTSTINVVDVGSGTGISTRLLYDMLSKNHDCIQVYGVEPGYDMRQIAIDNTTSDRINYVDGTAEFIPFEDASVNIVTAAQAAHWFNRPRFYSEAKRVLKENGIIAIFENIRDHYNSEFLSKYEDFQEQYAIDPVTKQHSSRYDREKPYDQELEQFFGNHTLHEFKWTRQISIGDFLLLTQSSAHANYARKNIGEEEFSRRVIEIANEYQQDGFVQIPYRTQLHVSVVK